MCRRLFSNFCLVQQNNCITNLVYSHMSFQINLRKWSGRWFTDYPSMSKLQKLLNTTLLNTLWFANASWAEAGGIFLFAGFVHEWYTLYSMSNKYRKFSLELPIKSENLQTQKSKSEWVMFWEGYDVFDLTHGRGGGTSFWVPFGRRGGYIIFTPLRIDVPTPSKNVSQQQDHS